MSDVLVPNIICFQIQKQLATLNNIRVLLKGGLIDLRACNFMHAKTSLHTTLVTVKATCRALVAHIFSNFQVPKFLGKKKIMQKI